MGNRYKLDPVRVIDVNCQFCTTPGFNLPIRETFKHLFFECPTNGNMLEKFRSKYWPNETTESVTKLILYGTRNGKKLTSPSTWWQFCFYILYGKQDAKKRLVFLLLKIIWIFGLLASLKTIEC